VEAVCGIISRGQHKKRTVARGSSPLSAGLRGREPGLGGLDNEQPTTAATRHHHRFNRRSRLAAQPRKSAQSGLRARCSYTSSVLRYIPVGRGQRDETNLGLPLEEEHDEGTTPRRPCFVYVLTHGQTPAESSTPSLSAEPADTVAHGLQVLCESTNPIVEYAFHPVRPSHS
jgi:hypothetical protein